MTIIKLVCYSSSFILSVVPANADNLSDVTLQAGKEVSIIYIQPTSHATQMTLAGVDGIPKVSYGTPIYNTTASNSFNIHFDSEASIVTCFNVELQSGTTKETIKLSLLPWPRVFFANPYPTHFEYVRSGAGLIFNSKKH